MHKGRFDKYWFEGRKCSTADLEETLENTDTVIYDETL